ncbi:hypothetical protein PAXINDRAFT_165560 [Paxillus involutus ATCC 200175]|nr:hypothetical protein PAXINDRAFT_165560 [Paxillus involutus ATCC 200175]
MAEPHAKPISPISQVLQSIGLTREDLLRHSDQMRQFLTAEDASALCALSADSSDTLSSVASILAPARTRSNSRSLSRANASHLSQTPSPSTPVKSEPIEPAMPLRHMDSMQLILERKSRQTKREKRGKTHKDQRVPSPSPVGAAFSLDAFMQSRDLRRVPSIDHSDSSSSVAPQETLQDDLPVIPFTPKHRKYYRDYDTLGPPSRVEKDTFSPRHLSPTPTRSRTASVSVYAQPTAQDADPFTPRKNKYYKSPLPSSSPPQSSPFATPSAKRIVNLVSSPGPMGPLPDEEDYDSLPYKLPPGPYSTKKPDLSYAALIGQAILSSPEHRLTLQEIYDWITIVYPHFQRNETTWMNSIRHVLSTTVCFRKVPRDRSLGRTLWAIWDCDLECFANGNFRKEFCAEYKEAAKRAQPKKRPAEESGSGRRSKRQKKTEAASSSAETSSPIVPAPSAPVPPAPFQGPMLPPLVPTSHLLPLFPSRSSAHHQPYYDHCTQLPAEVIFPPLPPSSNYARVTSGSGTSRDVMSSLPPSSAVKSSDVSQTSPTPPSSSLPELIPNNSSSSPQLPSEEDHLQTDVADACIRSTPPLEPGIMLLGKDWADKGKQKQSLAPHRTPPKKSRALPPLPVSPTLDRRVRNRKKSMAKEPPASAPASVQPTATSLPRPFTPPPRPTTPPRNRGSSSTVQLSPLRTPLSHKGLHMSPSASLVYYKSHLDPPPPPTFNPDDGINPAVFDTENIRTPSRKRGHHIAHRDRDRDTGTNLFPPITPKKLVFPTPGSTVESPFRTPGARSIFDPHDPGALLDEEFARLGAKGTQESPVGLFEGRRGLLYESPNIPSPGKLPRWF